jgi:hypothetical protein
LGLSDFRAHCKLDFSVELEDDESLHDGIWLSKFELVHDGSSLNGDWIKIQTSYLSCWSARADNSDSREWAAKFATLNFCSQNLWYWLISNGLLNGFTPEGTIKGLSSSFCFQEGIWHYQTCGMWCVTWHVSLNHITFWSVISSQKQITLFLSFWDCPSLSLLKSLRQVKSESSHRKRIITYDYLLVSSWWTRNEIGQ